jgi:hypothetical protein
MGDLRNAYKILFLLSERKRSFRRSRHGVEDNIRVDLKGVGWRGVDWIHLAQNRDQWQALGSAVIKIRVPWEAGNFLTS